MHFAISSGTYSTKVHISEGKLGKLRNSSPADSRKATIKNAMTTWQKIQNCFNGHLHEEAFGHLYDFLQAHKSYKESNSGEVDRTLLKKAAFKSMDQLCQMASTKYQFKFKPQYNEETGQVIFNFMPDETLENITPSTVRDADGDAVDSDGDIRAFDIFENSATKTHWDSMSGCFSRMNKEKAILLLRDAYESINVSDKMLAFSKLSELANEESRGKFKIAIKDSTSGPAKISCCFGKAVVFHGSVKAGEDSAECLIDCAPELFTDGPVTGKSAKILFMLGKLTRDNFNKIFSEYTRRSAATSLDRMCRNNSNIDDVIVQKLSRYLTRT